MRTSSSPELREGRELEDRLAEDEHALLAQRGVDAGRPFNPLATLALALPALRHVGADGAGLDRPATGVAQREVTVA
jgi:hypothetical protein